MRTFPSLTLPLWLTLTGCSLIVAPDAGLIGDDGGGGSGTGGQPSGGSGGDPTTGGNGGNPSTGGGGDNPGGGGSNPGGFGGEGGVGGTGGEGGGPECTSPAMCPPPSGPCEVATCVGNVCGFDPVPSGTVTPVQTDFDCQENQCDGAGAIISVADNNDVPVDNNACTDDVCTLGVPSNPNEPAGTGCGVGLFCDGAGVCGGCTMASQCPGTDDECKTRTCSGAGICGFNFTAAGTDVATQVDGDCAVDECDGIGNIVSTVDNSDVFVDNLDCTTDECNAGVPENNPVAEGDACDDGGGSVCDDSGVCVECNVALDCGITTDCQIFTCTAANTCNTMNVASGTQTGSQTAGNCQVNQCNGNGQAVNVPDNADVPVDAFSCTLNICTAGVPSNPDGPAGVGCDDGGTGTICNSTGDCVECNAPADCPAPDTDCQTPTCSGAGVCGLNFEAPGTLTSMQMNGNCQQNVCNGTGGSGNVPDNLDVPVDGNECTDNVCTAGVPSNPNSAAGTVCSTGFCNGSGVCVECTQGSQCASGVCSGNVCQAATCTDLTQNGLETDIDCGGGVCPDCTTGQDCLVGDDCVSNSCTLFFCDPVSVLSTTPADAATGTAVAPLNMVITFNGAVNPTTIVLDTTLDDGACTGTIQMSTDDFVTCIPMSSAAASMNPGNTVATITANPRLSFGSTYKFRVTTGVLDAAGQPVAAYTSTTGFTTRTDAPTGLVISQVYGAGGNAGATYTHDFVELHNRSSVGIDITGWSLQYSSATGSSWATDPFLLPSVTIPAGGYYLVRGASNAAVGAPLPTPDAISLLALAGGAGKVALVNNTTTLIGTCPVGASIVDFVGYGATANCVEGTGTLANLTSTQSAQRRIQGCADTNSTSLDLQNLPVAPRNSASSLLACAGPAQNETGAALEADFCNLQFPQTLSVPVSTSTGNIFGRIFEAGTTEAAGAPPANVIAQVGYGVIVDNPELQTGWLWTNAAFNVQVGNDDEFMGSFTAPAVAGSYAYAFRFSIDSGATWTFCDADGAGSDPNLSFETPELGILTVTP